MLRLLVHREAGRDADGGQLDRQTLDIDGDLDRVIGFDGRPYLMDHFLRHNDRHKPILGAVVAEDVAEAGRDDGVEATLLNCPYRVLTRRADAEGGTGHEHAVWAIQQYGFDAVIAPSFSDIFRNNCTKNGLAPVVLSNEAVTRLWDAIEADENVEITIDMERLLVEVPAIGFVESFPMESQNQYRFLNGLDDVGITLTHADEISAYESRRPAWLR